MCICIFQREVLRLFFPIETFPFLTESFIVMWLTDWHQTWKMKIMLRDWLDPTDLLYKLSVTFYWSPDDLVRVISSYYNWPAISYYGKCKCQQVGQDIPQLVMPTNPTDNISVVNNKITTLDWRKRKLVWGLRRLL